MHRSIQFARTSPAALLVALCAAASGHSFAAPPAAAPAPVAEAKPHALVGIWRWTLPGKACTETLQYRADGTRQHSSGTEASSGDYSLPPVPSLLGFYKLAETTRTSNGQADCAGDVHAVSEEPGVVYLQLSPKKDQLIVCKTESLKACYGPLRRVAE